jgi:TonB family protein
MRSRTVVRLVAIPITLVLTAAVALPDRAWARGSDLAEQMPPQRDRRPGQARPATEEEMQLRRKVATSPADTRSMLALARLQEGRGATAEAEATLLKLGQTDSAKIEASHALAAFYTRSGRFDRAVATLERAAALEPENPSGHHLVAIYYFERSKDPNLHASDSRAYIEQSVAAENRALEADPDFFEALVSKNLLLREQAARERNPARQQALIREADALRTRAAQVRKDNPATPASTAAFTTSSPPPPPPPPPVPGAGEIQWVYAETSYTASGNTKTLARIKDVRPVYAPMVMKLGVQGTVVVEASVDHRGRVTDARVVESVPLLNQAVIDAVKQWQFDAATVDAMGDPILITVTARFVAPR